MYQTTLVIEKCTKAPLSMKMLSALFLSSRRYRVNRYKDKDRNDIESTSKLRGVEVKIRPCIHEMNLTILFKL